MFERLLFSYSPQKIFMVMNLLEYGYLRDSLIVVRFYGGLRKIVGGGLSNL